MATTPTSAIDAQVSRWRQSFAEAVVRTCPEINPDLADEIADAEYLSHQSLAPDQAAARWAARVWQEAGGRP